MTAANDSAPAAPASTTKSMDDIVALCRRRGFIWQSSEIYGGINGFWDYGPMGAALKKNLKDAWWHDIVRCPAAGPDGKTLDMVPVDCTIIMHPKVWIASGHAAGFNDPMVDCRETKRRYRADQLFVRLYAQRNELVGGVCVEASSDAEAEDALDAYANSKSFNKRIENALNMRPWATFSGAANIVKKTTFDKLSEAERLKTVGPHATQPGTLTEPRQFNLMFETYCGAIKDEDSKAWLRPETAQGIFTQFWNVTDTSRVKVPFGIAQQGKAFRNEVTPRNFTFRSREFEQMEIEFFIRPPEVCEPGELTPVEWYKFWREARYAWWKSIGLAGDNLTLREHDKDELSHYAKDGAGVCDVEYRFPFTAPGFGELEGIAHRSNFDLKAHAMHVNNGNEERANKMRYFDQERNTRYFPHVIEPSAGADRGTLALLCEAYTPTPDRSGSKCIMKFTPRMAPIKAGIFPLVNKDGMPEVAEKLYMELRQKFAVEFDVKGAIGKRYARMDEVGTPYCFTIDGDTLKDQTVTVRDRDTLAQERIGLDKVGAFLAEKIG